MNLSVPAYPLRRPAAPAPKAAGRPLSPPWRELGSVNVGGLTDIGFAPASETLLVISHDGRGLVDCLAGRLTCRETDNDFEFDLENHRAKGLGDLAEVWIDVAGIHGGGSEATTSDGWSLIHRALAEPDEQILLLAPGHTEDEPAARFTEFSAGVRVFGFSPSGRSFVIATGADVTIFGR